MAFDRCDSCFAVVSPETLCPQCLRLNSVDVVQPEGVLRPGVTLVERFLIGRLLGRGGFGATYAAWDMNLRVRVAIKEFLPRNIAARVPGNAELRALTGHGEQFQAGLSQFLEEARNLAQFREHASIISVLEFFPAHGTGYMVMEYLDGETLEQHAGPAGRIEPVQALRFMLPVADALRAVHAIGMVHRDVSPDNIILTRDGRVKLLDFGAARYSVEGRQAKLTVVYKPGYAPAEQYLTDSQQLPSTDTYAWTATLYRLITGDLPPPAPERLAGAKLAPATRTGIALPPGLESLLEHGLSLNPRDRYQNVETLQVDIQAVLSGRPVAQNGRRHGASRWLIHWRVRAALGSAVAAAVVASVVLAYKAPPPKASAIRTIADPISPITTISGVNPIDQARHQITSALRDMGRLGADLAKRRIFIGARAKLAASTSSDEAIGRSVSTHDYLVESATRNIQADLESYSTDIQGLASADPAVVTDAIDLERHFGNETPLRLLQEHVMQCRGGKLSARRVTQDLDEPNIEVETQ